ncbi:MAG: adenosine deaminase [Planctomycetes bacterium]|nr:adenosine deaminase [Planctomycetota bacterium]
MTQLVLDEALCRRMPKVLLHEHLDGGLRPATVIELARQSGYDGLPTQDPAELAQWFRRGADRKSLPLYLEGFSHTIAVMQTPEALERVAFEALEDCKNDGVVYSEIRFAPLFHTQRGLSLERVMEAVLAGLDQGRRRFGVEFGLIVCGMRNREDSLEMAELALDFRDRGCVGFDLAGEEAGHPPKRHLAAFDAIRRANFSITIHAGEAFGRESIWQAIQICGAHRIGHATRLLEDVVEHEGKVLRLGPLAQFILDRRIPLEICLSSNVQTGAVPSLDSHPFGVFFREHFRVTLNTDNRLMSATTLSKEYALAAEHFDVGFDDLEKITVNAMKSAFIHYDQRCAIIFGTIKPAFAKLRAEFGLPGPKSRFTG